MKHLMNSLMLLSDDIYYGYFVPTTALYASNATIYNTEGKITAMEIILLLIDETIIISLSVHVVHSLAH